MVTLLLEFIESGLLQTFTVFFVFFLIFILHLRNLVINLSNLLDNLVGDFLNVGQKNCKLPHPTPSKRRQVKPKMEALRRSIKEGNEKSHIFSMRD